MQLGLKSPNVKAVQNEEVQQGPRYQFYPVIFPSAGISPQNWCKISSL